MDIQIISYEIIIKKRCAITKKVGKNWEVVGTKEVAREPQFLRGGSNSEPPTRIEEVRGYTPETEKEVIEDVEVLKQTVEALDLATVIKAINGL